MKTHFPKHDSKATDSRVSAPQAFTTVQFSDCLAVFTAYLAWSLYQLIGPSFLRLLASVLQTFPGSCSPWPKLPYRPYLLRLVSFQSLGSVCSAQVTH